MKQLIKPIAVILTGTILLAQAKVVNSSKNPVKVAYAGIQVENVNPWAETELQNKLSAIFDGLNPKQIIRVKEVQLVARAQVDSLFLNMADAQFQRVADQTGAQYVFAGKFKNVSPDESRIMIQGDFYRYNAQLKSSYRYEVLKYYERMGNEATVIQTQLVDSIPSAANPASLKQVAMVFGTILLVGILFMSLTGTNVWAEGNGGNGQPPVEN
ncbi:MAG: hypothetical protein HOA15_06085 [Candidatus Marinimicrobia bacterium]|jgi:TolB-like protein|nr:hypothetical protein [Candidatus Neomarinimicrobiota bacterium]MBT3762663.1 hypothetical protein [Candidatus Neomarinimicrobiota bacterium]MBT4069533.1 hypothetical protein [Candidatus Neomarinimicrobiota bacterium]MBT4270533.1 hypothetical protein [Candidatus Neomarinimicrobiota bacterium]MBT4372706.1 hypothetical protein [Candidatus Neomarinimicrobiota bacterium]